MEIQNLVSRYPVLFHMAEKGTWPSIKKWGLLSTTAVLDHFKVNGNERVAVEELHRPQKMLIGTTKNGILLRDQKPMPPERLRDALTDGTTPKNWYKFLNGHVFTWAEEHRLFGLLNARGYRDLEHDVLSIDTHSLLAKHSDKAKLCRMNSGNTWPVPHKRSLSDFMRIVDYPSNSRTGFPKKEVVEIVFEYSIPDIAAHVIQVRRMKGDNVIHPIPI